MKKLFTIIISILLISGCQKASTNRIEKDKNLAGIHEITYEQLKEKMASDDLFVLYIGRPDCKDCREFKPILEEYLDENSGTYVYYLNIKDIRDASKKADATPEEINRYEELRKELDFNWTPILKLVNNGETIDEYTYLNEEYYELKGNAKKKQAKEKFIKDFEVWMTKIYK